MATIIIFNAFTNLSKQATSLHASLQLPNQPTYPNPMYPFTRLSHLCSRAAAARVSDHTMTFAVDAMMKNTQYFL